MNELHTQIRVELEAYMNEKTKGVAIFLSNDTATLYQFDEWMDAFLQTHYPLYADSEEVVQIKTDMRHAFTSLGKLHSFIGDDTIEQIMVNAPNDVWIVRGGKKERTTIAFPHSEEIWQLACKLAHYDGKKMDDGNRLLNIILPSGTRIILAILSLTTKKVSIIIRPMRKLHNLQDLIPLGDMNEKATQLLERAVAVGANILISGGNAVGKTRTLCTLAKSIPEDARIVSVSEDYKIPTLQKHMTHHDAVTAYSESFRTIAVRDCIKAGLALSPDRLLVQEIQDGEKAYGLIQAIRTAHPAMTTILANTPYDAIDRMHNLIQNKKQEVPARILAQEIDASIDLVVHVQRLQKNQPTITEISQVRIDETHNIYLEPLFRIAYQKNKENGELLYTGRPLKKELLHKFQRAMVQNPLD